MSQICKHEHAHVTERTMSVVVKPPGVVTGNEKLEQPRGDPLRGICKGCENHVRWGWNAYTGERGWEVNR